VLGNGVPFIAGAYIENLDGEMVALYHQEIELIQSFGAIPILFQTERMKHLKGSVNVEFFRKILAPCEKAVAFELGEMFAPNGRIYDLDTVQGIMELPQFIGMKHSSLNRELEWARLALRDKIRPDFKLFTGNDLAVDMVMYGSDYLLGITTFCPELFALRDEYWLNGDNRFYELNDALQHLGNVGFRAPVPAYKHSAALFLHLTGKIPSPDAHPLCPNRPEYEKDILTDCAKRLGLLGDEKKPWSE
jgi:4-hydroxy-tetrahydrodipicolinate synthase